MTLKLLITFNKPKTFNQLQEKGFSGVVRSLRYLDTKIVEFIDSEEVNN